MSDRTTRQEMIAYAPVIVDGERRTVSTITLATWAQDAIANGDSSIEATESELRSNFTLVKSVLADSGYAEVVGDVS